MMTLPNYKHVVEDVAERFPVEWRQAHTGSAQTDDWIKILAWELHQIDPRVGLNAKRAVLGDISDDALCYDGVSLLGDVDPHRGNAPVTVIDVIGGAGGPNPRPQWGAVGPATPRPHAAWIKPQPAGTVPTPAPPSEYWTAAHEAIRLRMAGRPVVQLAEQLAHTFPDEGWGEKRTSGGNWSPDTIARLVSGVMWVIKVAPAVTVYGLLSTGHVHRPVSPVNHLGDAPQPVDPPQPDPPPTPVDPPVPVVDYGPRFDILDANLGELTAMVARLGAAVSTLQQTVEQQREDVIAAVKSQGYKINATIAGIGRVRGDIDPKP